MKKSKKVVLIVTSCIVVLATIAGVIFGIVMNQVAPIVTKFEKKKAAEIAELKEKMPGYVFDADNRAGSVTYLFLLRNTGEGKAENFVKQHNLKRRFPDAKIKTGYGVVTLEFERDDYTNAVHNALNKLSKKSSVEIGSASVYSASYIKYKPDISQHAKNPTKLEFSVPDENAENLLDHLSKSTINTVDGNRILTTKEDYDAYVDLFPEEHISGEIHEFYQITKDLYDEDFFETNALLVTKQIGHGGRYGLSVDNVYLSDNKIYVVIRTSRIPSEYAVPGIFEEKTFYITVSKDAIKGAAELITLD